MLVKKRITPLVFAGCIVFLFASVACKQRDGDGLKNKVETSLKQHPDLKGITVTVKNDTVVLNGDVKTQKDKIDAVSLAQQVDGSVEVSADAIRIGDMKKLEDLTNGVREVLKLYPSVTAIVNDGTVILSGTLNQAKLSEMVEKIRELEPTEIVTKNIVKD